MKLIHAFLVCLMLSLCSFLSAQPAYVNYQGFLKDNNGDPLATGSYDMEFNIFDDPTANDPPVWGPFLFDDGNGDGHASKVTILNGRFNVILGPKDTGARDISDAFTGPNAFVEVKIDGGSPILPRQQILTTPYAFESANATTADSATNANTAASAQSADSATELSGTEWNAPDATRAVVTIGGVEKLGIGNPGKGGNGTLDVSSGHIFVDQNYGVLSTDEDGALKAGFDTSGTDDLIWFSHGVARAELLNDRFLPVADNFMYLGDSNNRWRRLYAANGSINTSDERLKTEIKDLDYGLDEVMEMRPTEFKWKDSPEGPTKIGLIAQELQDLVPEAVDVGDDQEHTLGITYSDLIPILINATKEQQEQIDSLQQENQNLEKLVKALEAKVESL